MKKLNEDENKKQTENENIILSYERDKIQMILDILNHTQFIGIQQAQVIAQISVILGNPITDDQTSNKDNNDGVI